MKIIINPAFKHLQNFIESLPDRFLQEGRMLQDKRNKIKVFNVGGTEINVKRYRVPIFINRVAYTFFRKSKASKAYYNALEVIERGFDTPCSIAYIEDYKGGLLSFSYYISLQCPFQQEMREFYHGPLKGNETLFKAFAQYTAALHSAKIYHLDYSPGNVLIETKENKYTFSLVDINRMKFISVGVKTGCKNFERMFENDELYTFLAKEYAQARGLDEKKCIEYVHYYHRRFNRKKRIKAFIKRFV